MRTGGKGLSGWFSWSRKRQPGSLGQKKLGAWLAWFLRGGV